MWPAHRTEVCQPGTLPAAYFSRGIRPHHLYVDQATSLADRTTGTVIVFRLGKRLMFCFELELLVASRLPP